MMYPGKCGDMKLAPGQAGRLDPVCDRFEDFLLAGASPRLEDFLPQVETADQAALFRELLALEVDYRGRRGDRPGREEYLQRFPEFADALALQFEADPFLTRQGDVPLGTAVPAAQPQQIGRYRIEKVLGEGGFGRVYLAYDDQLNRRVAIKVPRRQWPSQPEEARAYLTEARVLASLDHPNIVPVHDVGTTPEGLCYVVSKVIEGRDLAATIKQERPSPTQAAALMATIAEALHHAHRNGLVHRDIKPGNILLDTSGKARVADFGLALKEEDFGKDAGFAGTPAYMSPEQARGEGHRVDGRSDVFSLGVVFYELLARRRPFQGDTPGELFEQITSLDPRPPRQVDDAIPKELERICLKALAKRASERYLTAQDMAEDLRHFLAGAAGGQPLAVQTGVPALLPAPTPGSSPTPTALATPPITPVSPSSDSQPIKILPKGLRSFDAHDADFFLELLPGPRDRNGLPDSIRFWKTRIEEVDPDSTFAVGLVYGPSGCGKSSFVKAGLLPRLAVDVMAVYVEATANDTVTRLLNGLRKRCPALTPHPSPSGRGPGGEGLKETLAALRRGQGIPAGRKVLIVLDQFEQWLHATKDAANTELVQALRHCDGGRVQCVVMVRDDFWMAATRFMRELEIRLFEGQNSAAVDLFDLDHAKKVLAACGRAFGKLPENPRETSKEQKEFLNQALQGLTQEGKIICVRLAIFAQMMKGKPWTPATFKEVGGTEGVGVTFLEETFSAASTPPEHRYHQKAARAILKALLPESGTDLKGHMLSYAELLEVSCYGSRPKDFETLIHILDSEIRLLTPIDPEGMEDDRGDKRPPLSALPPEGRGNPSDKAELTSEAAGGYQRGQRYYQLTHDYLVQSLRDWLTRKQKETKRGRAELLLADRAGVWKARPENRQLPSLLQWLNIWWWTQKRSWTGPQNKMMRAARRYHAGRGAALLVILVLVGWGSYESYGTLKAHALRDRLLIADITDVPAIVADMASYRRWVDPLLKESYTQPQDKTGLRKKLNASVALLPVDPGQKDYLYERLLKAEKQEEVVVLRKALADHREGLKERLWTVLLNPMNDRDQRFRAACALAAFDPDDDRWEKAGGDVAATLAIQDPFVVLQWTDAFKPVGKWLIPSLADFLVDEDGQQLSVAARKRSVAAGGLIARVYGICAADIPDAYARLVKQLAEQSKPDASVKDKVGLAKRQASIGVALLVMGEGKEVWPLLEHHTDPTLRSFLIERLGPGGVASKVLTSRLEVEKKDSIKRAILLSLGGFGLDRMSWAERQNLLPRLLRLYREDVDPGIHGATEWLLRQWQVSDKLEEIDTGLATGKVEGKRQWYVNRQGQTMMVVPKPGWFQMGEGDGRHPSRIDWSFEISSKEVTVAQFRGFCPEHKVAEENASTACPVNMVSWYDAAAYCNWLSEQEGIPKDQWWYQPNQDKRYADGMKQAPNHLQLGGYRLPAEAEWEYACRARAETRFSFGEAEDIVDKYGWYSVNSFNKSQPVGLLKPNDFGLFDMHGNVSEWTRDGYKEYVKGKAQNDTEEEKEIIDPLQNLLRRYTTVRVLRGGSFFSPASGVGSAYLNSNVLRLRSEYVGFRVARTHHDVKNPMMPPNVGVAEKSEYPQIKDHVLAAHSHVAADYLPNDTEIVVLINLKQILDSALVKAKKEAVAQGKRALEKIWAGDNPALQYMREVEFDVFQDLHSIVAANNGSQTLTAIIFEGRFDVAKWTAKAEQIARANPDTIKITKLGSQSVYEINLGAFATLINDKMIVSALKKEELTDALGRIAGIKKASLKKGFAELLNATNNKQSIDFVATGAALAKWVKRAPVPDNKVVAGLLQNIRGWLPNIKALSGAIDVQDEVKFKLDIYAKDEANAAILKQAGSVLLFIVQARVSQQAKTDERFVPLVDIAKTLRITNQGDKVLLTGTVSRDAIEMLMKNIP